MNRDDSAPAGDAFDLWQELREAGDHEAADAIAAAHPELAAQFRAARELARELGPATEGGKADFADFRIVRELGRGGMGVVYE